MPWIEEIEQIIELTEMAEEAALVELEAFGCIEEMYDIEKRSNHA